MNPIVEQMRKARGQKPVAPMHVPPGCVLVPSGIGGGSVINVSDQSVWVNLSGTAIVPPLGFGAFIDPPAASPVFTLATKPSDPALANALRPRRQTMGLPMPECWR